MIAGLADGGPPLRNIMEMEENEHNLNSVLKEDDTTWAHESYLSEEILIMKPIKMKTIYN